MIKQLEVDGVPALLAPTTGPMHAGLVFRVGQADETLARKGVTHLVEHLALHSFGSADYHYNGVTGVEYTYFHTQGTAQDVAAFLTGVCAALRSLPIARLATEKEILRTEQNSRRAGVSEPLALWRHGARDFGLSAFPEWGLHALDPEDLSAWVARYFTRANAALWVAGDAIPAGLKLDLPDGVRQPARRPSSALPVTPAYFSGSSGAIAWDAVVPRGPHAAVFTRVLERRMFRELRQEAGLSYSINAEYEPRGGDTALITAAADALPEKQGAVLGGFVDLLAALRVGRIDTDEVTSVVNQACDALRQAEDRGGRLPSLACDLLTGREIRELDDALAAISGVTRDEVARVAVQAYDAGLLMTPGAMDARWAGYEPAPAVSDAAIVGTRYRARGLPHRRLVAGPEGVSVVDGDDIATVRYDAVAALLAWRDGGRRLIGHDGMVVNVEPTLYRNASAAVQEIDARVPEELRVDLPTRGAGDIPRPQSMSWQARWRPGAAGVRGARAATLRLILPSATISVLLAALAIMLLILQIRGQLHAGGLVAVAACGFGVYHFARRVAFVLRMLRS